MKISSVVTVRTLTVILISSIYSLSLLYSPLAVRPSYCWSSNSYSSFQRTAWFVKQCSKLQLLANNYCVYNYADNHNRVFHSYPVTDRRSRPISMSPQAGDTGSNGLESSTNTELMAAATRQWVKDWVVKHGLCPWAYSVLDNKKMKVIVVTSDSNLHVSIKSKSNTNSDSNSNSNRYVTRNRSSYDNYDEYNQLLLEESEELIDSNISTETTLIVLPELNNFDDFLEVSYSFEDYLEDHGLDKLVQVATFHPNYCFANSVDTNSDSYVENYTNRSPYPTIHLLLVEQVSKAIEQVNGDTDFVWQKNIQLMRSLGLDAVKEIQNSFINKYD